MSEPLKSCPFCGAPGELEHMGGHGSTHRIAKCSKCKCDMHFYPTIEMAAASLAEKEKEIAFRDFAQARASDIALNYGPYAEIQKSLSSEIALHEAWRKRAEEAEAKLYTAEATLGTLMLWIEEANASVTDEEWDRCMKTPSGMVTRPRVDNMLASRLQKLREKVAGLQLNQTQAPVPPAPAIAQGSGHQSPGNAPDEPL